MGQQEGQPVLPTPQDLQKWFPKSDAHDGISGAVDTPGNIF